MAGATIGGELSLKQARISNPAGTALHAGGLQRANCHWSLRSRCRGWWISVTPRLGSCATIPPAGQGQLRLDGLTYQALNPGCRPGSGWTG